MKLLPEDGTASPLDSVVPDSEVAAGVVRETPPAAAIVLGELIRQALNGTMPVTRSLKENEPRCFSARHINMVFDAVQGPMTNGEIQDKYGVGPANVSVILNHPYTDVLKAALLSQIADNLTDPLERLRAYTHEMIDTKIQLVRDLATPKSLKDKIASDILDRAGYGARKQNDVPSSMVPDIPAPILDRFSSALEASQRVRDLSYDRFTQRVGGNSGESAEQSAAPSPRLAEPDEADGAPSSTGGLPTDSPRGTTSQNEKVA